LKKGAVYKDVINNNKVNILTPGAMSDYVVYFAILALLSIFYVLYQKHYVFAPKMQMLNIANDFRYARRLNAELIDLFWLNQHILQKTGNIFNGITFEAAINDLQTLRSDFYTTTTYKQLVGKQKTQPGHAAALQAGVAQQIKMQHELKAGFNKLMLHYHQFIAA